MTHLANKGESRARILAGLFDAVCENVQVLIKPRHQPAARGCSSAASARSRRVREHFRALPGPARHDAARPPAATTRCSSRRSGCALRRGRAPGARCPRSTSCSLPPPDATPRARAARSPASLRAGAPHAAAAGARGRRRARRRLVLGFDIGSTGSKAVALDAAHPRGRLGGLPAHRRRPGRRRAGAAASSSSDGAGGAGAGRARLGVTGSGREIVGSLLTTCYGGDARLRPQRDRRARRGRAALRPARRHHLRDRRAGRQVHPAGRAAASSTAAMNEACSAGTGSFIEEQGQQVRRHAATSRSSARGARAPRAASRSASTARCSWPRSSTRRWPPASSSAPSSPGIYDSIIQNYLNRVKGSRSVGQVIFCQGMPFAADALAAAVARQTGVRGRSCRPTPAPSARWASPCWPDATLAADAAAALDPARFLAAPRRAARTPSSASRPSGCGGAGNQCRIDRLHTVVAGERTDASPGAAAARCTTRAPRTQEAARPRARSVPRARGAGGSALMRRVSVPRAAAAASR